MNVFPRNPVTNSSKKTAAPAQIFPKKSPNPVGMTVLLVLCLLVLCLLATASMSVRADQTSTTETYYQLTENDLESAAEHTATLSEQQQALNQLKTQQYTDRTQLYNELVNFFTTSDLKELIPKTNAFIQQLTFSSAPAESGKKSIAWQVNKETFDLEVKDINKTPLSDDIIQQLAPFQGEVFYHKFMLELALNTNIVGISDTERQQILQWAKKEGLPKTSENSHTHWQAKPGCGCQGSRSSIFSNDVFYGSYPYWNHQQEDQIFNFSQLDRIGYAAAIIQPDNHGSQLILPPNWRTDAKYSQFSWIADRYRTAIDLVVTLEQPTIEQINQLLSRRYTPTLIDQMVDAITLPMDDHFINTMIPIVSLGFADIPTIGNGITLDINLSGLTTPESQRQFIRFVRELKTALLRREGRAQSADPTEAELLATPKDQYYLNIVLLSGEITKENNTGFYTLDNLHELAKYTNLMIVRPKSSDQETRTELDHIRSLHHWFSQQPDQLKARQLFEKTIPMIVTEKNRYNTQALEQVFQLSSWAFTGAAYWPMPLSDESSALVNSVFFATDQQTSWLDDAIQLSTQMLNWVCPHRWYLRLILFIAYTLIIATLAISLWHFPLRPRLSQLPFVAVSTLSLLGSLLAFMADPYFKDYRGLITLIFILMIGWILLAVYWARREGDKP